MAAPIDRGSGPEPPISSAGRASLSRKPLAPARSASYTYASTLNVVTASTRIGGSTPGPAGGRIAEQLVDRERPADHAQHRRRPPPPDRQRQALQQPEHHAERIQRPQVQLAQEDAVAGEAGDERERGQHRHQRRILDVRAPQACGRRRHSHHSPMNGSTSGTYPYPLP